MARRNSRPRAVHSVSPKNRDEADARLAEASCLHEEDPTALVLALGLDRALAALKRAGDSSTALATAAGRMIDNLNLVDRACAIDVEIVTRSLVRIIDVEEVHETDANMVALQNTERPS